LLAFFMSKDTKTRSRVCVVGDAFIDILAAGVVKPPQLGQDSPVSSISMHIGGSAGNTAVGLATLGVPTKFFCSLGKDSFSDTFVKRLDELHIDYKSSARFLSTVPSSTSSSISSSSSSPSSSSTAVSTGTCIVLSGANDRGFVTCWGANLYLTPEYLTSVQDQFKDAAVVHFGGYYTLRGLHHEDMPTFCRKLRKLFVSATSRDSSPLPSRRPLLTLDCQSDATGRWAEDGMIIQLLKEMDLFMPSETEAMAITKAASIEEAGRILSCRIMEDGLVIIKCGEQGAFAFKGGSQIAHSSAFQLAKEEVIDTTGAGDAFNAAFLASISQSESLEDAMQKGCAAGAMRVRILSGSDDCPTAPELETFIKKQPRNNPSFVSSNDMKN